MAVQKEKPNLVTIDRNVLKTIISEIEDKLDELEMLTDAEFMKETEKRISEIEKGEVEGLDEEKVFELLEK